MKIGRVNFEWQALDPGQLAIASCRDKESLGNSSVRACEEERIITYPHLGLTFHWSSYLNILSWSSLPHLCDSVTFNTQGWGLNFWRSSSAWWSVWFRGAVLFCKQRCIYFQPCIVIMSFPGGTSGKESACSCRRHKRCGFDPWVGRIPWRRAWQPTPVLLPGECHGQRSLAGYGP